jgi:hypothetical protein
MFKRRWKGLLRIIFLYSVSVIKTNALTSLECLGQIKMNEHKNVSILLIDKININAPNNNKLEIGLTSLTLYVLG